MRLMPRFSPVGFRAFAASFTRSAIAGILASLCAIFSPALSPALKAQRVVGSEMVKLTFPNADVRDVLAQYELLVGKHLIYDNAITGQVNINVPDVPKDVAIRIIEITLIMNGFHIVPVDSDPTLLKVVGVGRAPKTVGLPLITDPEPIPDGEQVVMYLVKLQYADPNEMVQVLTQAMPASRTEYGPSVVALPKSQSLLITENTTIIRTLQRIIRAADVRPTEVEGEFITLQRASAKDVVQMLEKLFEKPDKGATTGAPRPSTPAPAPNAAGGQGAPQAPATPSAMTVEIGGMTEDSMISGKVRLTADERTNRIYVVSRPVNLPLLRKLIQDFDEDVRFDEPAVRLLKYVSSGDILDALVKAISDPGNKDAAGASGSSARAAGGTQPAQTGGNFSQFSNNSGNRGTGASSLSSNLSLQTEARIVTPNTVLVGNARVMADNRRNAIIVIGSADVREKVFKLLDQLDVRAPQVMLSTIIGELTLSSGEQLGLNYILNNGQRSALSAPVSAGTSSTSFSGPISIDSNGLPKINLQQLLSDTRFARLLTGGATGVSGFVAAGDSMSALVTALESTSRFKVTSRPSVFASNNKKATIASGDEVAVATSIQSGVTGQGANPLVTNSNVSYKPIELRLEVVPLINSDREVYLDIFQQVQEQTDTTVVDNNRYPRISTRALNTSVMVPNEGTLVLGGLIKQSRDKQTSGIPFLSRAPLIGPLFRSTASGEKRTELVIMIRPSVTLGPEEDIGVRDRNLRPMQIPSNIEDTLGEESPDRKKAKSGSVPFRSAADVVRPVVVTPVGTKSEPAAAVPVRR
jgi:general secretion pathway protein D